MRIESERKLYENNVANAAYEYSWRSTEWINLKHKIFNLIKNRENLSDKLILNIGCGRDVLFDNFRKEKSVLIECDLIKESLHELKTKGTINLICCDAHHLPFKNDRFDLVFCIELLHHLHPIEKPLAEMIRVLKKNHNIYCVEPNKYSIVSLPLVLIPLNLRNKLRHLLFSKVCDGAEPESYEYPLSSGEIKRALIKSGVKSPLNAFLCNAYPNVPKWLFITWNFLGNILKIQRFSYEVCVYGRKTNSVQNSKQKE